MKITAGGISVNYRIDGPEDAPWVTFSTSIAASLGMFDAQAAALAGRYRVLRYDTRGHGGTESSPPPYDFDLLVGDVVALWDALGVARSHMVGLSLGGMVATGLALDHPDRLGAVVIANSRLDPTPEFRETWETRIAFAREKGLGALVEATIDRWLTPGFIADHPAEVERLKAMIRDCSLDGFAGAARALQALDYFRRLDEIRRPCLFIAGREDAACPADSIRAAQRQVAGSEYVELSPAAHISNLEQPDSFNRVLLEFLGPQDALLQQDRAGPHGP